MPLDVVQAALDRTVPTYAGRTGDWPGIVEAARRTSTPTSRRRWVAPALAACAVVAAIALFWPSGESERVLERALAATDDGPVIHFAYRSGTYEFYDLERRESRRAPSVHEVWFDPSRGLHLVARVDGKVIEDLLLPPGRTEVDRQFVGLAAAYRSALRGGTATVGERSTVGGRAVYWVSFHVSYPDVGIPAYAAEHAVAVDATTYEPVAWRIEDAERPILSWETLPAGAGDFTAKRRVDEANERWFGTSLVGTRTPEQARDALPVRAVWLGAAFAGLPLASIREVRYESGGGAQPGEPTDSVPGLEFCYGGEPCDVLISEATEPHPMAGRGHGWSFTPPAGSLALVGDGLRAYLVHDGLYVTLEAETQEQLLEAAKALAPMP